MYFSDPIAGPKISIITVCYNARYTIDACINSVIAQSYPNIEYIIIDGGSDDGTLQIADQYRQHIDLLISEPDKGVYDAMNKGIKAATGEVIGMLNADDVLSGPGIVADIAECFKEDTGIVYGNLNYVKPDGKIIRRWKAGSYTKGKFNRGWMPPHPTFYCKTALFNKLGSYDTSFGTACDYELMLRFMHLHKINAFYLNKVIVNMNIGGLSNRSYKNRAKAWYFDHKAMRKNGVFFPLFAIIFKPLRKIMQFI